MKNNIEVDFDIIDEEEEIVETFNHAALPVVSKEREKAEKIALKAVKKAKKDAEKVEKLAQEGRNLESEYYLSNEEVENIFDIIENIEDIEY